jgi:hypothetical protein
VVASPVLIAQFRMRQGYTAEEDGNLIQASQWLSPPGKRNEEGGKFKRAGHI